MAVCARHLTLTLLVLLLGACASGMHVYTPAEMLAREVATAPLVEAAVSQPMTELYTRAQSGGTRDRIIFSLALKGGRSTASLPDPAVTSANIARADAIERQWFLSLIPVSDAPSREEIENWVVMTRRHMFLCVPCEPDPAPEGDADASYAAYVQLNSPGYWTNALDRPLASETFTASTCVWSIAASLRAEAAVKWLEKDLQTATGRRAVLDAALHEEMTALYTEMDGTSCLDGRFEGWRESLRANRPELDTQMAAFLEQWVGDPGDPRRRM